jgi:Domain of unknown function (DUF397)
MTTVRNNDRALSWRKATASGAGGCVEVAATPDGGVAVRDSKHAESPVLRYTAHEWRCFLSGAKAGEFDQLITSAGS